MKKLFVLMFSLLYCLKSFADLNVHAHGGCISNVNGVPTFTMYTDFGSPTVYAFISLSGGGLSAPIPQSSTTVGGDMGYIRTYSFPPNLDPTQCYTIYLSLDPTHPEGVYDWWTVCPCPMSAKGCYNYDENTGFARVTLIFNDLTHSTYGSGIHAWADYLGGAPIAAGTPPAIIRNINGLDWDYTYDIPVGQINGGCMTFYYSQFSNDPTTSDPDPRHGAWSSAIVLCPCCSKNVSFMERTDMPNYINIWSQMPGTWNFGDGSPTVVGALVTHTYSMPGSYTITMTTTNANESPCVQNKIICLGTSDGTPPCLADFFLSPDGNDVSVIPVNISSTATYSVNWGDGSPLTGYTSSHHYLTSGTYTICVTATDHGISCTKCITYCISNGNPPAAKPSRTAGIGDNDVFIRIAPNPASDEMKLQYRFDAIGDSNGDIIICDATGRIVAQTKLQNASGSVNIPVAKLASGSYTLSLRNNGHAVTVKHISIVH